MTTNPTITKPVVTQAEEEASCGCPTCEGRGIIETGVMEHGPGGIGFATVPCEDCSGTGEITAGDHRRFKSQFGTDVLIGKEKRVVFFDYEGDYIFVWWLPGDDSTDGPNLTEAERQQVYNQLYDWQKEREHHDFYD